MSGFDICDANNVNTTNLFVTGYVGIGTSSILDASLGTKVDIRGNGVDLLIRPGYLGGTPDTYWVTFDIPGTKNLYIWDNLAVSDYVGIGTTSPPYRLTVMGDINATGFIKGSQLCIGNDCRNREYKEFRNLCSSSR